MASKTQKYMTKHYFSVLEYPNITLCRSTQTLKSHDGAIRGLKLQRVWFELHETKFLFPTEELWFFVVWVFELNTSPHTGSQVCIKTYFPHQSDHKDSISLLHLHFVSRVSDLLCFKYEMFSSSLRTKNTVKRALYFQPLCFSNMLKAAQNAAKYHILKKCYENKRDQDFSVLLESFYK